MDIHYNAFISYRHHPDDIKVAEQIHRGLEHYRIPKALKKTRDTKMRLFRDKEELPITSNLSDDITRALENSDFLIVICSTHTKESLWVQREIETFLQTHEHSRILTVLVDGEPSDTIPQILYSKEDIDPMTGEKRTVLIEPLSCDWRISRRRARREELPRLAAALLGCGYDELRQREKQYRTRRLAAVLSVAMAATLAFTSYVIYNSIQIRKANEQLEKANIEIRNNLEQAQINQSQYLAGASQQRLEAGDRMMAMALAMAALPESEGQRPYVSQAEKALGEAVGIYIAEEQAGAVGCITCDALINLFEATENRDRMFVFDQRHVLSVWDIATCRKLASVQTESSASKMLVTANDGLILQSNRNVSGYDRDLNLLWQMDGCSAVAMSEDRNMLLADKDNTVLFLDAQTGREVREALQISALPDEESTGWSIAFRQETYDPDQPLILEYNKSGYPTRIVLADAQSHEITALGSVPEDFEIRATGATEGGNILVLTANESGIWNGRFGEMMTSSQVPVQIRCFTPAGEELWTTDMSTYSYSSERTLYAIPGTGRLFCQVDNLLLVLDAATGEVLSSCETGAMPVWVRPSETFALALLEDGSAGSFQYDGNSFNSLPYFKEGIAAGFGGKGYFVQQRNCPSILIYGSIMDRNWEMFDGTYNGLSKSSVAAGNYLAVHNYDAILVFDVHQKKLIWSIEEASGLHFQLLGFTDNGAKFWFCNNGREVVCVETENGEYQIHELPENVDGASLYYSHSFRSFLKDETVWLQAMKQDTNAQYVLAFDTTTLQTSLAEACRAENGAGDSQTEILTACEDRAYFWENSERKLYEVRMQTGTSKIVLEGTESRPVVQFLNDGSTAMVAVDNRVIFADMTGEVLFTTDLVDTNGVSAYRTENEILLLADSGDFLRFDFAGNKQNEIEGHQYTSFFRSLNYEFEPEQIQWSETGDGDIFVNVFRSGNLINTDQWALRAWVPNCAAYLPEFDLFATSGKDPDTGENRFGLFVRYTPEQIREMAKEALGVFELTEEQKAQYGIS